LLLGRKKKSHLSFYKADLLILQQEAKLECFLKNKSVKITSSSVFAGEILQQLKEEFILILQWLPENWGGESTF
jgi:adenine-specific DNA methylase